MSNNTKQNDPKLLVMDYYDSIIQNIDIFIESLLDKMDKTNADESGETMGKVTEWKSRKPVDRNGLNRMRVEMIKAVKQAESETMEFYETNDFKEEIEQEAVEMEKYLRRKLFVKNSIYLHTWTSEEACYSDNDKINDENCFEIKLFIFDFYLDDDHINLLKYSFSFKFICYSDF